MFVFLLEGAHKRFVGRIIKVASPLQGIERADHRVAHSIDDVVLKIEAESEEGNFAKQAVLLVLLDEIDAHATGQEDEHAIRIGRANLGDFRAVVQLIDLGVDLGGNRPLVVTLEARHRIAARHKIGYHSHHRLQAPVLHVLGDRLMRRVVLVAGAVEPWRAAFASQFRGTSDGRNHRAFGLDHAGQGRHHYVAKYGAGDEIHFVALEHALGDLLALLRVDLIIANDHLGGQTAQPTTLHFHQQIESGQCLSAEIAARPGHRGQESHLDPIGGECHRSGEHRAHEQGCKTCD